MKPDLSEFPFGSEAHPTQAQRDEAHKRWDAYPELIDFVDACRDAGSDMVEHLKSDAVYLYRKHQ